MWYWTGGFWWPGFVLMAVLMVVCMVLMSRISSMGGMGMCGFGRWLEPRDEEDADECAHGDRARADVGSPEGGR